MNKFDKLRNWLDRIVDAEFRDLIRSFFQNSPQELTRLPARVEDINRGDFLGHVQILGRLDELEKLLQSQYPDRVPQEPPPTSQPSQSSPQRVPFTNQEYEMNLVLAPFAPAYYLLDAPAGYGKTEFLSELERRFKERDWQCAYVSMDENCTLPQLVTALAEELSVASQLNRNPRLPWELRLGGALRRQWSELANQGATQEGLVLLIDLDKRPSLPLVEQLLQKLIPAIQKSLRALEFFANKHNRLRIIIAGRYLAARLPIRRLSGIKILPLSPFSYEVIQNSAGEYLASGNEKSIRQFSAHLFYLTGGHPGCMAQVFSMYMEMGVPPDSFLEHFGETIWHDIVQPVVHDIRHGITQSTAEFHRVLNRLSVFRYLDYEILKRMLADEGIANKNEYNLADDLTATYLFDWKGRFLRDDITRRLLACRLRHEMAEIFPSRCQQASNICEDYLQQPNVQSPEMWTIEYLFQSLQQHANAILEPAQRALIRQQFFSEDLPKALQIFINARDIPPERWRREQNALNQAMKEDWEFQFTVNYYLREEQYSDEPYNKLEQQIKLFFEPPSS